MAGDTARVDLAHASAFRIGDLEVRPSTRELARGGKTEVLEPRVMQVLVALHRAGGAIVSRDDLVMQCWEGRVVGDDAINRVISRLRRSAGGIAGQGFRVETISRVGYRLVTGAGGEPASASPDGTVPRAAMRLTRRTLIGGALAGGIVVAGGIYATGLLTRRTGPDLSEIFDQASFAMRQDTREGQNQAIGLYRHATEIAPDNADAWGLLAAAYAYSSFWFPSRGAPVMRQRAAEAAKRAFALQPDNIHATLAMVIAAPMRGHWLEKERGLRGVLRRNPADPLIAYTLAMVLGAVGRSRESLELLQGISRAAPLGPGVYYRQSLMLWACGELDATDRLLKEARALFPTQFALWFANCYILMYSGRASAAIAMIEDVDNRPNGIEPQEFDHVRLVAQAIASGDKVQARQVLALWREQAHTAAGRAENAMQFATALGDPDMAFEIGRAYFFGEGFIVPEVRFTAAQGSYTAQAERKTEFLFNPALAPIRADPRFAALVRDIGLERYWREAGAQPDYRKD